MTQPLDGVFEKLTRTGSHTEHLEKLVSGVLETVLYTAVTERYVEDGENIGHFTIRAWESDPHPVNVIGVVLGDIVHNLRSALDHLAWQLSILAGNDPPPSGTEFPVFRDEPKYCAEKGDGSPRPGSGLFKIRGLAEEDRAIIKGAQPFQIDDPLSDPLWVLHDLANIDKHRVCPVTVPAPDWGIYGDPTYSDCVPTSDEHRLGPYKNGAVIAIFHVRKTGENPEMKVNFRFSYTVHFSEDGPGRGAGMFRGIDDMRNRVRGIVRAFDPRFE